MKNKQRVYLVSAIIKEWREIEVTAESFADALNKACLFDASDFVGGQLNDSGFGIISVTDTSRMDTEVK